MRLRLLCFPYAGGAAHIFHHWHQTLLEFVEVWAVQLPGRGRRLPEPPFTNLHDLVAAAAQALAPHLDRPFAFFGHSMGAMIAFELARHLRRAGAEGLAHLFVSGCRAPQLARTRPVTYDLPEQEFLAEIGRLKDTPAEVLSNPELMQLLLPILRADFTVTETCQYRDEPPLTCPLTVFGSLEDEDVPGESLSSWRAQTTAAFSLCLLPGDHFFLHGSQALLLKAVGRELQRIVGVYS